MRVLVVEDEPSVRASLVELVEELGYVASSAGSVADARDALGRPAPDVCITDLGLPDGSGLDVVRAAKAARPDCAVLVLTGKGSILAAVEAMKAGAHDFLLKPLKPALLASSLARLAESWTPHPGGPARARRSRPARGDGRPVGRDARGLPPDRPRRGLRGARHDHRGERHGEGSRRPHRARALAPRPGAVRRGQLRGDLADPRRERALRAREGLVHRGGAAPGRHVRDGARGHPLPGRGDRDAARPAGEIPPRPRHPRLPPGGRQRRAGRGRAARGELEPRPRRGGQERLVPVRPLLPAERLPALDAAAPRCARRTSRRSRATSCRRSKRRSAAASRPSRTARSRCSPGTTGPGTCAS